MRYEFQDPTLQKNCFKVYDYILTQRVDVDSQNFLAMKMDLYPELSYKFVLNTNLSNLTKVNRIKKLFLNSHNFFAILGTVGSGKTALAYYYLKAISESKKVYWVGSMKPEKVPFFAEHIYVNYKILKTWEKEGKSVFDFIDDFSVVYFDELSHLFPKGSIDKQNLDRLTIYRHRDLTILGSTQNSSIISIDLIRFFTGIFILQTTFFHSENERENEFLNALALFKPDVFGKCTFYSAILQDEFFLGFNYPLLEEYDKMAGKSFKNG